jgi:hypothetical protein
LPQTGESWLYQQTAAYVVFVRLDFRRQRWPRTDEAHRPGKDVEKLGKFVQTEPPQHPAYAGYSWIILDFEEDSIAFVVVGEPGKLLFCILYH